MGDIRPDERQTRGLACDLSQRRTGGDPACFRSQNILYLPPQLTRCASFHLLRLFEDCVAGSEDTISVCCGCLGEENSDSTGCFFFSCEELISFIVKLTFTHFRTWQVPFNKESVKHCRGGLC